ncbi:PREDICTED: uncharacterized protein LOC108972441 [Bactrocera latifrons]|uniref:Mitotic checkpoint serine/threonine-protein kinase BUB1 n=1 Tax=Bactrocera latifrons TaxID=174628 RepID=A0A0K8WEJ2_BACLA|nr:PREDICTED: uncharacterized protein LOC108972441 [Bactrocera latifrons]
MDFEDAKENIQPLAAGRNASILQASLRVESPQELLARRRELEQAIREYSGNDPLEPWYAYISWIEQSFPSGGKESGLEEVLTKCLSQFENEVRYFQDRRMIKLYMKFIDSHQHPMECYQQLFNAGIGTMIADFYICWAYHYDLCGNTRKADEIFRRGIACRAQPFEELQEAHQHFGFSVAQRLMYQDDDEVKESTKRQFEERRLALTSLRGHRRKAIVGSVRTGSAVKSYAPGTIQTGPSSSKQENTRVQVFQDENVNPNSQLTATVAEQESASEVPKSVVRSIIDAARNQENLKEPGPWNKAHDKKMSGKLFSKKDRNTDLGFSIHEDTEMEEDYVKKALVPPITEGERNYEKPFKYPKDFKNRNLPQKEWLTPVTIENEPDPRTFPQYNKCFMYPRPNIEFQPEEYRAYRWFKKRGISNNFTAKRDTYWCSYDVNRNVRQYPNFAKASRPQRLTEVDAYFEPENRKGLMVCFRELYDSSEKVEYQVEELMARRLRRYDTILMTADMDETACGINERAQRRKSFFPLRKSIMPRPSIVPMESKEDIAVEDILHKESLKITNIPETSNESNKLTAPPSTKTGLPFEIFEDTISTATSTSPADAINKVSSVCKGENPSTVNSDFKFKTPALPTISTSVVGITKTAVENKLGFEIYTEPSMNEGQPSSTEGAVGGAIFDPEETCSTQIFNVFLKSQSVSTPKMAQKVAPRQFGSILKSVPKPPEFSHSPESNPTPEAITDEHVEPLKAAVEYSPLTVKQLSTILETSEHGTTQGTYTTGGTTTKVSNSTSDGEGEREMGTRLLMPVAELETVEEQSRESSTIPAEVMVSLENINLHGQTMPEVKNPTTVGTHELSINKSNVIPQIANVEQATPAYMRLQTGSDALVASAALAPALNFSIFEDEPTEAIKVKQAGNFTRIDEREDTAAGYAIRSVRFQEDKTETIPKMLLYSRSIVKFQEDKTETIPKMPIATPGLVQFEAEKTDTLPKITLSAPGKNLSSNLEDSFEFFGQTPPGKSILHPRYEVSAFKECMEARTPLLSSAKRHCDINTPDAVQLKAQDSTQKQAITTTTKVTAAPFKGPALFEDEVDKLTSTKPQVLFSSKKPLSSQKVIAQPMMQRVIARDSFLSEFSYIEETQPQSAVIPAECEGNKNDVSNTRSVTEAAINTKAQNFAKCSDSNEQQAKSDLSDSYLNDFSEIMDSQPVQSDNNWLRSASKNKVIETQKKDQGNFCNSFLKDFSAVMESKPTVKENDFLQKQSTTNTVSLTHLKPTSESKNLAPTRNDENKAKFDLGNSYLKDFSMVSESQPVEVQRERQQPMADNKYKTNQQTHEMDVKKLAIANYSLKDFSVIMESQPVVHERKLEQHISLSALTTTKPLTSKVDMSQHIEENIKPTLGCSYLNDFSIVPESQPVENKMKSKICSNQTTADEVYKNSNAVPATHTNELHPKEFSVVSKPHTLESATKRAQEQFEQLYTDVKPAAPAQPLMFLNSFVKDFSGFRCPPAEPLSSKKTTSRLTFLNDSRKFNESIHSNPINKILSKESNNVVQNSNKLHFLEKSRVSLAQAPPTERLSTEKSFELNAETAMFSTNISMIKNSTLLPQIEANSLQAPSPIKEQSLHIKQEKDETSKIVAVSQQKRDILKTPPKTINVLPPTLPNVLLPPSLVQEHTTASLTGAVPKQPSAIKPQRESKIPQPISHTQTQIKQPIEHIDIPDTSDQDIVQDGDAEMSIYFKHTPKTPKIQQHIWTESSPSPKTPSQNIYVHREVDLNVTNQIIDNVNVDPQVNPFNGYLQSAFLEQIEFSNYIEELPSCMLVGHVSRLNYGAKIKVNDVEFDVLKLIGEGAYGAVYCGTHNKTGKKYALKQERPPNFWEYYICLEVHSRLNSEDLVSAFMSIDYALIGNNASILISPFSVHGSLITVCNKVKKHTLRNVDEYVVMILTCELLSIIDHLHAINIIHADIKADNFILMKNLDYNSTQYALQLIDFGVSIDMKLFKSGQTFNYVHNENAFKCVEMREGRPWTYQLDLYGLAGVIHVLLFGKFMDIAQRPNGIWMHKTHVPRYINRTLWDSIFQSLLNVRDCETMPNLQNLRALIKEEIAAKEKFVMRKIAEFNSALSA